MARLRLLALAAAAGAALVATPASAQLNCNNSGAASASCAVNVTASLSMPTFAELATASNSQALTAPTFAALGSSVEDAGPVLTIRANRSWALKATPAAANATSWTYTGTLSGVKPASDLLVHNASAAEGSFTAITTSGGVTLGTGSATNSATVTPYFRTKYAASLADASNAPGTYALTVVLTLTAQ